MGQRGEKVPLLAAPEMEKGKRKVLLYQIEKVQSLDYFGNSQT